MAIVREQIRCSRCGEEKPLGAFPPSVVRRGNGRCRPCSASESAETRARDPERVRANFRRWYANNKQKHLARTSAVYRRNPDAKFNRHLMRSYGITLADYDRILAFQGGGCALCGKPQRTEALRLAVDHDHRTGRVRGILCHRCNCAIGALGDSAEKLTRVIEYFTRSEPCLSVAAG